ncbi:MAG TPA: sigma-54 dependent transcriptional regulator [Pyrinomonadaceae bacterium]
MTTKQHVLVVDDEKNLREGLAELVASEGFVVSEAANGQVALELLRLDNSAYDVIFLDVRMPLVDGLEVLRTVQEEKLTNAPFIVISAFSESSKVIEAMRLGAYDYITKPLELDEIVNILHRASEQRRISQSTALARQSKEIDVSETDRLQMLGTSRVMRDVFKQIGRLAATDATVLITGESGTGKELVATAIHKHSARSTKPFIAVNCGALPENLIEAELFGHERGAFTGAEKLKKGRFELAHTGTLFLDEASELTPAAQVKLLRSLQERRFQRVGGTETITVDVRVIAASNQDLKQAVSERRFREDLYYRLSVIGIKLPPLRARVGDVPLLAEHFLERSAARNGLPIKALSDDALRSLLNYKFPGNVRELENLIERAVVNTGPSVEVLTASDLFTDDAERRPESTLDFLDLPFKEAVSALERELISRALIDTNDNRTEAARRLGINRRLLYSKMEEHGIKSMPVSDDDAEA